MEKVAKQFLGGLVRLMKVVEKEDGGSVSPGGVDQGTTNALEETRLSARPLHGRGLRKVGHEVTYLGDESRGLIQGVERGLPQPAGSSVGEVRCREQRSLQHLDEGAVGEVELARVAAGRKADRPLLKGAGHELLRQARLSDAGLPFHDHQTA